MSELNISKDNEFKALEIEFEILADNITQFLNNPVGDFDLLAQQVDSFHEYALDILNSITEEKKELFKKAVSSYAHDLSEKLTKLITVIEARRQQLAEELIEKSNMNKGMKAYAKQAETVS